MILHSVYRKWDKGRFLHKAIQDHYLGAKFKTEEKASFQPGYLIYLMQLLQQEYSLWSNRAVCDLNT